MSGGIKSGQKYRMVNRYALAEPAWFTPHEVFGRQGQLVVFGTLEAHRLLVPSTMGQVFPEVACCFPLFPRQPGFLVMKLMSQLNSPPLFLEVDGPEAIYLPNGDRHQVGEGKYIPILAVNRKVQPRSKEVMLERATQLIQVYLEWKHLGEKVPFWFRDILAADQRAPRLAA